MNTSIRFVSVLALVAAAVASQAVAITIGGTTASGVTAAPTTFTTTVASNSNVSDSPFDLIRSGLVTLTGSGAGNSVVFSTANASDGQFTLNFSGNYTTLNGLQSIAGLGNVTGATGLFAPYRFTSGTLLVTSNTNVTDTSNIFSVTGNVTPVPEPASFAALGVGALALLRRRRKA